MYIQFRQCPVGKISMRDNYICFLNFAKTRTYANTDTHEMQTQNTNRIHPFKKKQTEEPSLRGH